MRVRQSKKKRRKAEEKKYISQKRVRHSKDEGVAFNFTWMAHN